MGERTKLIARQSKTLEEAVENYRLRYGRNPPKGFDKWFNWAKENDVKIIDDVSCRLQLALAADTSTTKSTKTSDTFGRSLPQTSGNEPRCLRRRDTHCT